MGFWKKSKHSVRFDEICGFWEKFQLLAIRFCFFPSRWVREKGHFDKNYVFVIVFFPTVRIGLMVFVFTSVLVAAPGDLLHTCHQGNNFWMGARHPKSSVAPN